MLLSLDMSRFFYRLYVYKQLVSIIVEKNRAFCLVLFIYPTHTKQDNLRY